MKLLTYFVEWVVTLVLSIYNMLLESLEDAYHFQILQVFKFYSGGFNGGGSYDKERTCSISILTNCHNNTAIT